MDVEEEEEDADVEEADVEEEGRSQGREAHFVRACAIETRMDIAQEPFCMEMRRSFCASLRSRNAHGHVRRRILGRNLQGKCRTLIPRPAFCASLRSQNAHDLDSTPGPQLLP